MHSCWTPRNEGAFSGATCSSLGCCTTASKGGSPATTTPPATCLSTSKPSPEQTLPWHNARRCGTPDSHDFFQLLPRPSSQLVLVPPGPSSTVSSLLSQEPPIDASC